LLFGRNGFEGSLSETNKHSSIIETVQKGDKVGGVYLVDKFDYFDCG